TESQIPAAAVATTNESLAFRPGYLRNWRFRQDLFHYRLLAQTPEFVVRRQHEPVGQGRDREDLDIVGGDKVPPGARGSGLAEPAQMDYASRAHSGHYPLERPRLRGNLDHVAHDVFVDIEPLQFRLQGKNRRRLGDLGHVSELVVWRLAEP